MRILVTGAYGFIGSKIVEKLCAMGHQVTAMDNSETYGVITPEDLKKFIQLQTEELAARIQNPGRCFKICRCLKSIQAKTRLRDTSRFLP